MGMDRDLSHGMDRDMGMDRDLSCGMDRDLSHI